ncbi:MAG TPA: alpha/beta fold hydrolase, partial [Schlesneria sp.]
MPSLEAHAEEIGAKFGFEEHFVEFRNQDVKLAGSLLLPKSEVPVPAVVFVHGAGRQTRESYREVGEYFASHGVAALIYDKRGTGKSDGAYESYEPYENLVNDAQSAVALLKQRREIAPSQIGIWGLSQGAYISAAAASRSNDIKFIIVVGADVADGMMFYFRDNLFRRYGLSDTLRDVAEKLYLVDQDLQRTFQDGFRLSSFAPRSFPPPDKYVHSAWSHVNQPVLAMWGQLDQHVPVGESVAGLKNSLGQASNVNWTIIILPGTNHDLKISETGALQSQSHGYPPGALQTMIDWARSAIDRPLEIGKMKQEGFAPEAGILPRLARYENLRWYGNGTVQAALWILFLITFLANTIAGLWCSSALFFRRQHSVALSALTLPTSNMVVNLKRAISALNFLILVTFSITALLVIDQLHPNCPSVLLFVPLLGTVSTLATFILLIVLAKTPRDHGWTAMRRLRFSLDVFCLVLFVPFMFYWNL